MTTSLPTVVAGYACPRYVPLAGGHRCRDYLAGGSCAQAGVGRCIEWLRVNAQEPLAVPAVAREARDLFGAPIAPPAPRRTTARTPAPTLPSAPSAPLVTDEDVVSFRALHLDVRLRIPELGEVWLVPAKTGQERHELLAEELAVLIHTAAVFPGSHLVELRKRLPSPRWRRACSRECPRCPVTFRNTHLSFSRLSRFEQCPLSFKFTYVDKLPTESGVPLRFGTLVHRVIEKLLQELIADERTGTLSEARAFELLRNEWPSTGLVGAEVFSEALAIVRDFVRGEGVLDSRDVLAVEQRFELPVARFKVVGALDRVNRIDDETVEVVDFKTNRIPFTREEVDESLQMSIYAAVARRLWPWAKRVRLTFALLRHGLQMSTERSPDQLTTALAYVSALGETIEATTDFAPRLNATCCYCDHCHRCPAYREALASGQREFSADPSDLDAIAREREDLVARAKIIDARKNALDKVLKARLKECDELVLAGTRYSMFKISKATHPLASTLALLAKATGLPEAELVAKVATIDKDRLDALVKELGGRVDKSKLLLLRAELEATAERSFTPKLWAKQVHK